MYKGVVAAALGVILTTAAPAQTQSPPVVPSTGFLNGNQLYERCNNAMGKLTCLGYVVGIADAILADGAVSGWKACIPVDKVSAGQLFNVVTQYLASHPEVRFLSAVSVVAGALHEAFPCKS
jgi:Rap1a immunity proteins